MQGGFDSFISDDSGYVIRSYNCAFPLFSSKRPNLWG